MKQNSVHGNLTINFVEIMLKGGIIVFCFIHLSPYSFRKAEMHLKENPFVTDRQNYVGGLEMVWF